MNLSSSKTRKSSNKRALRFEGLEDRAMLCGDGFHGGGFGGDWDGGGFGGGAAADFDALAELIRQETGEDVSQEIKDAQAEASSFNAGGGGCGADCCCDPNDHAGGGGGTMADFEPLIELIRNTVEPDSWEVDPDPKPTEEGVPQLSLIVANNDVQDEIEDLLEQLRKLQNLQITIEVRFVTVSDRFFERIGIDFDFDIDENAGAGQDSGKLFGEVLKGDSDKKDDELDFEPVNPNGGIDWGAYGDDWSFDPNAGATVGFAILSDIEAFFFLNAVKGDSRQNVLQAPKVTLFNGQQANVSDTSQRPFVTSITPVVG